MCACACMSVVCVCACVCLCDHITNVCLLGHNWPLFIRSHFLSHFLSHSTRHFAGTLNETQRAVLGHMKWLFPVNHCNVPRESS